MGGAHSEEGGGLVSSPLWCPRVGSVGVGGSSTRTTARGCSPPQHRRGGAGGGTSPHSAWGGDAAGEGRMRGEGGRGMRDEEMGCEGGIGDEG